MHGYLPWQGQGFQRRPSPQPAAQPFWREGSGPAQRQAYYEHPQQMPAAPGGDPQAEALAILLKVSYSPCLACRLLMLMRPSMVAEDVCSP